MSGRGRGRGALAHWETNKANSVNGHLAVSGPTRNKANPTNHRRQDGEPLPARSRRKNIQVTHVVDVDHFWARIGTPEDMEKFDKYMAALNTWCEQQPPMKCSPGYMPAIGQLECVRQAHTGLWRRARITRQTDNSAHVLYLDHGDVECVPLTAICSPTPNSIAAYPEQAKHYALGGIEPVDDTWCPDSIKLFCDVVFSGNKLEVEISEGTGDIKMFVIDDQKGRISVGDILIREGFAVETEVDLETNVRPSRHEFDGQLKDQRQLEKVDALLSPVGFTRPVKTTAQAQDTTRDLRADYFADTRAPKFASKNNDVKLCFPHAALSGAGRADSSSDWRAECPPFESSRQRYKPHLASPEDFLGATTGQGASTREKKHEGALSRAANANQEDLNFTRIEKVEHSNQSLLSNQTERDGTVQASHAPNGGGRGTLFGIQWGREKEYSQHPSQPQLLKTQPLSENTEDKTQKAELDWQVWKYQRAVKRMLDRMTTESAGSLGSELEALVTDSRLSRDYQGVSEVLLLLQMVVDRVVENASFADLGVKACISLQDLGIPGLDSDLTKVLTESRNNLTGQLGFSNWQKKCRRFCTFLGKLYLATGGSGDNLSSLKVALNNLISDTLHHWTDLNQNDDEAGNQMSTVCLKYLLTVIGPMCDQAGESSPITGCFKRVREHVLSACLSIEVKSQLLDLLLLRAAGWSHDKDVESEGEGEVSENADDGDVVIESDDNDATSEAAKEERDPDTEQLQDCDDYSEVKTMLSKLKLQHLFAKFEENCIRDSLLVADKEEFKKTLQEAGFPPGVILEIRMYVDKDDVSLKRDKTHTLSSGKSENQELAWSAQVGKSNYEGEGANPQRNLLDSEEGHFSGKSHEPRPSSWSDGLDAQSNKAIFARKDTPHVSSSNPSTLTATEPEEFPPKSIAISTSTGMDENSNPPRQTLSSRMPRGFRPQHAKELNTIMPYKGSERPGDSVHSSMNNREVPRSNQGFSVNTREAATNNYRAFPRNTRDAARGFREAAATGRRAPFDEDAKNWRAERGHGVGSRAPFRPSRSSFKGRGIYDQAYDKPYKTFGPGRGAGPKRNARAQSPPRPFGAGAFIVRE